MRLPTLKWTAVTCLTLALSINMDAGASNLNVTTPEAFAQQKSELLAKLNDGATYSEISVDDRRTVLSTLNRMEAVMQSVPAGEQLPVYRRDSLATDQERINQILSAASADSRVVCRREKTVGTHRAQSQCLTVGQRRELRERAQQELSSGQRSPVIDRAY
jgi:hypothetical protein